MQRNPSAHPPIPALLPPINHLFFLSFFSSFKFRDGNTSHRPILHAGISISCVRVMILRSDIPLSGRGETRQDTCPRSPACPLAAGTKRKKEKKANTGTLHCKSAAHGLWHICCHQLSLAAVREGKGYSSHARNGPRKKRWVGLKLSYPLML